MPRSIHILFAAALVSAMSPSLVLAQSAGSSSGSSPSGSSPGTVSPGTLGSSNSPTASSPAPSGGRAMGGSAAGAETPVETQQEEQMKRDTTICKGC